MKFMSKVLVLISALLTSAAWAAGGGSESGGATPYLALDPPFVVNIQGAANVRYLQVTAQVKLSDPSLADTVKHNMAPIRDAMIMLLGDRTADQVATLEGKEQLRHDALEAIQATLQELIGQPAVEEVYFTGFVLQ